MVWLTYRQAARRAGVHVRTVQRWKERGLRSRVNDHGEVEFDEEDLLLALRMGRFANPKKRPRRTTS